MVESERLRLELKVVHMWSGYLRSTVEATTPNYGGVSDTSAATQSRAPSPFDSSNSTT
jgi:hypothetical protein